MRIKSFNETPWSLAIIDNVSPGTTINYYNKQYNKIYIEKKDELKTINKIRDLKEKNYSYLTEMSFRINIIELLAFKM